MEQIIIRESNFDKARKKIRSTHKENKKIIFSSDDDELNRKIIEKEPINTLLLNLSGRKDKMKQRDSGFNHVLAKLAKKKNIAIGINLDEVIESKNQKEKSQLLTRLRQNIKLCSKNKLNMAFISPAGKSKKDIYDLKALGLSLGMPTWMIKSL